MTQAIFSLDEQAFSRLAGPREVLIPVEDLDLSRVRVEHALGYDGGAAPEPIPTLIEDILAEAPCRLNVRGGYRILHPSGVRVLKNRIELEGVPFDTGEPIASLVETAGTFAVFVATAGPELDEWGKGFFSGGDLMGGYVVDALGTVVAERACDWMEDYLQDTADALGWGVTAQYGPGYCGWHLSEQHKLFGLLPPGFCGVTLSESALMRPVKSVSGIIGMGEQAERRAHGCVICTLATCYRRKHLGG